LSTQTPHYPVADQLRDGTVAEHRAVEDSFDLKTSMGSPVAYRQLLERLWGLHYVWEDQARALLDASILGGRLKTPWLHADLRALGLSNEQIQGLAVPARWNSHLTRSAALGAMYVLEGSSLGGEVIFRYGVQRLAIAPDHCGRFFYGYGPATSVMWSDWRELLQTQYEQGRLMPDEALVGAKAMFAHVGNWLRRQPPQ
jgi:heme oxygenase (biliverdin-IX-beta and delta-forming)